MKKIELFPAPSSPDSPLILALRRTVAALSARFDAPWPEPGRRTAPPGVSADGPSAEDAVYEPLHEPHWHTFAEFCFVIGGRGTIVQGDDRLLLGAGDACLIPPDTVHCEMPDVTRPYEALWLAVGYNRAVAHVLLKAGSDEALLLEGRQYDSDADYGHMFRQLLLECRGDGAYRETMVKTCVLQLLLHMLRHLEASGASQPGRQWKEDVVREVIAYAERNYGRHIRMSEISHELCISANHLNAIFKAATGRTIMRHIEELKLDKARQWLRESGDSVQEIAFRLGFYDPYHFSKTFKKETGLSPTEFRSRGAKQD